MKRFLFLLHQRSFALDAVAYAFGSALAPRLCVLPRAAAHTSPPLCTHRERLAFTCAGFSRIASLLGK